MEGHRHGDVVVVGGDARQRFHDARGYGRPLDSGEIGLTPVEAAHLLLRGDLDTVDNDDFRAFLRAAASEDEGDFGARFLVYTNLRERGFYLSPAREGWVDDPDTDDFIVYERGTGPREGKVQYRVRVVGERTPIPAKSLGETVVAIVDEESEITYFETDRPDITGATDFEPPAVEGVLLPDRVMAWDPPGELYRQGFYGRPLGGRDADSVDILQLSLLEAASLARRGALVIEGGAEAVETRGRTVEGEHFDRRLRVYEELRSRAVVPKTGFKFGADFRTYANVESVDELGHSELLVRVLPMDHVFSPRELALDVRLAGGVRKRMVFALTDDTDGVTWLSVGRLTP